VLEEGVATHRDIDFGMMAGAGLDPRRGLLPPFMKADVEGSSTRSSSAWKNAAERYGEALHAADDPAPPRSPGPTGPAERAGLLRLSAPGRRAARRGRESWRTREDGVAIAWLANGQMNSISPQVIRGSRQGLGQGEILRLPRARDRLLQSVPLLSRRGHQGLTSMDEAGGEQLIHTAHALFANWVPRASRRSPRSTELAFGGGCELAMSCDVRIAARSALFGQPEIQARDHSRLRRHPALPRLVGSNKALEMNLIGDPDPGR